MTPRHEEDLDVLITAAAAASAAAAPAGAVAFLPPNVYEPKR